MKNADILFQEAERTDWETPEHLFAPLHREFHFTVDAAAAAHNAKLPRFWSIEQNGLQQPWDNERVWCNPPYGPEIGLWVAKAASAVSVGAVSVLLVPARTDTRWWHHYVEGWARPRFIQGRVSFVRTDGKRSRSPFPSVILVYRPEFVTR